jgi:hypothetical protein
MDKTKMENEVWETLFKDWGEVLTLSGDTSIESPGVRSDNKGKKKSNKTRKAVRKTTKENSKEDESL